MSRDWRSEFDKLQQRERSAFQSVISAMDGAETSINTESRGGLPDYVERVDRALEDWRAAHAAMGSFFEEMRAESRLEPEQS
jgi:hypothetical protein